MSTETIQFIEMVRQAAASLQPSNVRMMYCEQCGKQTPHIISERGDWEIYTCGCGCQKSYCVR